jgi:hypothetical protein
MPSLAIEPEIAAGYAGGPFRFELHGQANLAQHSSAPTSSAGASVHAAGGGARGCYAPVTAGLTLLACLGGEIDAMWASGYRISTPLDQSATWITLGGGTQALFRLSGRFAVRADLEALVPLGRPRFVTADYAGTPTGLVHEPARVWGRLALGAEVFFF